MRHFGIICPGLSGHLNPKVIAEYRREWKLPLSSHLHDAFSQLAQLSQQPVELEFPRQHLPQCFHFTEPYHNLASRGRAADIVEQVISTGKPVLSHTNG